MSVRDSPDRQQRRDNRSQSQCGNTGGGFGSAGFRPGDQDAVANPIRQIGSIGRTGLIR